MPPSHEATTFAQQVAAEHVAGRRVQVGARMRKDLRNRLKAAAHEHDNSLNAEIVYRLERSFEEDRIGGALAESARYLKRITALLEKDD